MTIGKRYGDGRFEVLELLGQGGMGTVYLARDHEVQRHVALKVVDAADRHASRLERFRREGEVTAGLQHPGIVKVHSFGYEGAEAYLAYELVQGARTLGDLLRAVPLSEGLRLLVDTGEALGHAHAQGVVHRDVKPDNVLVTSQGEVRVADFGLAAAQGQERLTRTGALVGTPYYMSPEQFSQSAEPVTPATDVWALGVMLYQLLTGEFPFDGSNLIELGAAVADSDPQPPRSRAPGVPADVEAICLKALSREPAERYPNGAAFAADLRRSLSGEQVAARPRRWRRRVPRRLIFLLSAALPLLVLGLVVVLAGRDDGPRAGAGPTSGGWQVAPGDTARVALSWTLERGSERSAGELIVEETVTAVDAQGISARASVVAVRIELDGDLPVRYDTREDTWLGGLNALVGESFELRFTTADGKVVRLDGVRALQERVRKEHADAAPAVAGALARVLNERALARDLSVALAVLPPSETGTRSVEVWPEPGVGLRCELSVRREGERVGGRLTGSEVLEERADQDLRDPSLELSGVLGDGRVRACTLGLGYRLSGPQGSEQVRWTLRYTATPTTPGATGAGESDSD